MLHKLEKFDLLGKKSKRAVHAESLAWGLLPPEEVCQQIPLQELFTASKAEQKAYWDWSGTLYSACALAGLRAYCFHLVTKVPEGLSISSTAWSAAVLGPVLSDRVIRRRRKWPG